MVFVVTQIKNSLFVAKKKNLSKNNHRTHTIFFSEIQSFKGLAAAGILGPGLQQETHQSGALIIEFNKDDKVIHPDYIPRKSGNY